MIHRYCVMCQKEFIAKGREKTCSLECKKRRDKALHKNYRENAKANKEIQRDSDYNRGFSDGIKWVRETLYNPKVSRAMMCDVEFFDRKVKEKLEREQNGKDK